MTEQERINESIQRQIDAQNARIDNVLTKVDTIIGEMRDRDNQRATEIRDLRNEIRTSLDSMGKHVRNLAITSMAAIGAMVVTVIISILKS